MVAHLRKVSDCVVHESRGVGAVHVARLRMPDGSLHTWSYLVKRPFVLVVAVASRGIVFVSQHRYPQRRDTWELVKGGVEPGERAHRCAQRELAEETGYRAKAWRRIGRFTIAPGYFHQVGEVYLARQLRQGPQRPEAGEAGIEVRLVPRRRIPTLIARGQINDSTTLAGLLLVRSYLPL